MTYDDDTISNPARGSSLLDLITGDVTRRSVLRGGLVAAGSLAVGCEVSGSPDALAESGEALKLRPPRIGFESVPSSTADAVVVPPGYTAEVVYAWGDPISNGKAFAPDASDSADEQAQQAGMHHDGMHFFPLDGGWGRFRSRRGLLVVNHEYTDDGLLHVGGMEPWTAEKVRKSQAAHGVSVVELAFDGEAWHVVRPSKFARRVTGYTSIEIVGPAAGDPLLQTSADPTGRTALGTLNNCGHGHTPWDTYLTCEENWNGYFATAGEPTADTRLAALQKRYGVSATGAGYRWHEHDERFDIALHPNEAHRFGWVVEIDPFRPNSTPVKRTALGRLKHEGAWVAEAADGRAVVYCGDDERFEYIYKFVSALAWRTHRERGESPLDHGTLYVARFDADGGGEWLPLQFGSGGLDEANGFHSQAEVLIETRRAADVVGATKMDRPEWIAIPPRSRGSVYVTLTNNNRRGTDMNPGVDAANPRIENVFGHVIRWSEADGDHAATAFDWELFVVCGDPANANPEKHGDIRGDLFGSPDGLWFDDDGRLWIQTDVSTSVLNTGDYATIGNNQMLVANPVTREIRRFLTGPSGCEVTGVVTTPDRRTMFVNIQHPGEPATERNDPANPKAVSSWPDGPSGARPRSATIAIRRTDGGVIGT